MNEKIFINIASFKDPSLIITIKSAILHAKYPENLVFGIGAQYYDDDFPNFDIPNAQIKVIKYNPDTAPGVVKVRYEISKLLTDEKYFFMIDSHVLFLPNWDVQAKEYLEKARGLSGHDRVCISGSEDMHKDAETDSDQIKSFFYSFQFDEEVAAMIDHELGKTKRLKRGGFYLERYLNKTEIFDDLQLHPQIICNNFFTYSDYLEDVGLDSQSQFLHEEPYLSWKTHISGWDLYRVKHNYLFQYHHAYFNLVWGNDPMKRRYVRPGADSPTKDEIDMFAAMVFNKSKNYAAKNQRRSLESFWNFMGKTELRSFQEMQKSEAFVKTIKFYGLWDDLV
jgi:hypothetical protein